MTLLAYTNALKSIQEKADFAVIYTRMFTNFGGRENNIVLAGYGPEGEAVYQEVK